MKKLLLVTLFLFVIASVSAQDYNSYISSSCGSDLLFLAINNNTNALADFSNTSANYYVCIENNTAIARVTSPGEQRALVVSLYNSTNSRVSPELTGNGFDIYLDSDASGKTVQCSTETTCSENRDCILGLYSTTNSRVTACNDSESPLKVCCRVEDVLAIVNSIPWDGDSNIATKWPTLFTETNKPASCEYNLDSQGFKDFQVTGNTKYHESTVFADEGDHNYVVLCTSSENSFDNATDTLNFDVKTDCAPTLSLSSPPTDVPPNELLFIDANAVCQQIHPSKFLITLNGTEVDAGIRDTGGGSYRISFITPSIEGDYELLISIDETSDSATLTVGGGVEERRLTIEYVEFEVDKNTEHLSFRIESNKYIAGAASDSDNTFAEGDDDIFYNYKDGIGYIFFTRPGSKPEKMEEFLANKEFRSLQNPSFGYPLQKGKYTSSSRLSYDDVIIQGDSAFYAGVYSVVIKNKGVDPFTGKTIVEVSALR